MPWFPLKPVIEPSAIATNLVAYCLDPTTQGAALVWAGGTGFKLVKTYQNSVAEPTKPVFPCIAFSDDDDEQDFTEDIIPAIYTVNLELSIHSAVPDTAVTQARVYVKAFRSMIRNCPDATLLANTGALSGAVLQTMAKGFLPIKAAEQGKSRNSFLQQVQIRVRYALIAANGTYGT